MTFTVLNSAVVNTAGTLDGVTYTPSTGTAEAFFTIPNEPGAPLPNTGGPGILPVRLIGIAIACLAVAITPAFRRKFAR